MKKIVIVFTSIVATTIAFGLQKTSADSIKTNVEDKIQLRIDSRPIYYSDYQVKYTSGHFPGNTLNPSNGTLYYDRSTWIGGGNYIAHYHGTLYSGLGG